MVKHFTLDRVVQAPAGFDPDKLYSFQGHWMKELPLDQKLAGCLPYLVESHLISEPVSSPTRDFVSSVIVALGDRLKVFSDILAAAYFFRDEIVYDEKTFDKRVRKPGVPAHLAAFRGQLAQVEPF